MDNFNTSASTEAIDPRLTVRASSASSTTATLSTLLRDSVQSQFIVGTTNLLITLSQQTGGFIHIEEQFGFFPVLIDSENKPIALFELIEAIDEVIDYDQIKERYPTLSYAQINGAIAFLRRVAEFNLLGIDPDQIENQEIVQDEALLDAIRKSLGDSEAGRVLNHG